MKTIRRFLVMLLLLMTAVSVPVYAEEQETDPYTGELITWDQTAAGEEEDAGLSENQGMDQSVEERIQDQFGVLQQMYKNESAAETDGRELTTCHLEIPDYETFEWNQSNVTVILRGDEGTKTVTLYRQSGFKTVEQMKTGRYTMVSAKTIDGSMIFRTDEPWFEITTSGENVIFLYPGKKNITERDITISADLETVHAEETSREKAKGSILIIIVIVMITLFVAAFVAVIITLIIRKRKERFS